MFGAPNLEEEEVEGVIEVMRSGWLGTGPKVAEFERDFAAYKGVERAAAFNSCTAGLHLSILAAGVGPGDEVITTPMTFCATINAIIHAGATPVLADVDPITHNIDPASVAAKISERTKAVLVVHFAGRAVKLDEICDLVRRHNLVLIEDCAHAIETEYHGRKAGSFGDFGCFSFYVTKNIITGEGGMVIAKDQEAHDRLRILGLHGMSRDAWKRFGDTGYKHYEIVEAGFKYNMMDLQAAIGVAQLKKVERYWLRRQEIWEIYQRELADLPIELPAPVEADTRHAYHLFTILVDEARCGVSRDRFLDEMTARKIGIGVHYLSQPEHPYYQERFGWRTEDYPHAARIGRQTVSLPLTSRLTDSDVQDVIDAVRDILR